MSGESTVHNSPPRADLVGSRAFGNVQNAGKQWSGFKKELDVHAYVSFTMSTR